VGRIPIEGEGDAHQHFALVQSKTDFLHDTDEHVVVHIHGAVRSPIFAVEDSGIATVRPVRDAMALRPTHDVPHKLSRDGIVLSAAPNRSNHLDPFSLKLGQLWFGWDILPFRRLFRDTVRHSRHNRHFR
jgi:hypothetical protein